MLKFLWLISIVCLVATGCQSESKEVQTDKVTSSTLQHLMQDKVSERPLSSGNILLKITPSPLTSKDNAKANLLNCSVESKFEWYVNSKVVYGESSKVLTNENFSYGDIVKVISVCGNENIEHEVTVENSPPAVIDIRLLTPQIKSGQDLTVSPITSDIDGDYIELTYRWSIDGKILANVDGATLPSRYVLKGANISLKVIPFDGNEYGEGLENVTFSIPNSRPIISSQPTSLTSETYTYNVLANDPDHDPLTYQIEHGPEGMMINSDTGELTWSIKTETQRGNYEIIILVKDDDGAWAKQSFNLLLSNPEPLK